MGFQIGLREWAAIGAALNVTKAIKCVPEVAKWV